MSDASIQYIVIICILVVDIECHVTVIIFACVLFSGRIFSTQHCTQIIYRYLNHYGTFNSVCKINSNSILTVQNIVFSQKYF